MVHHGQILKREVALSDKKVSEIADMIGVVRQTIYELYKVPVFTHEYIQLLKKAGIDIVKDGRQMSGESNPSAEENEIFRLKVEVGLLRKALKDVEKTVIIQEQAIIELQKKVFQEVKFQKKYSKTQGSSRP